MSKPHQRAAILASLAANIGIAIAKLIGFFVTGASALLAESVHSFVDSSNQILLLIGGHQAMRKPTDEHPFGFGRIHYLYAFMVSIVLFSLGGVFAIWQGVEKVSHPHPIESPLVAYVILILSVLFEALALRTALHEARHFKPHHQNWWDFLRETKLVNYVVLAIEDLAALVGLTLAFIGISASILLHDPFWDGISTFCIGILLIVVALFLAREVSSLLVGESADEATEAKIRQITLGVEHVDGIVSLKTVYMGPMDLFVAMQVTVGMRDSGLRISETIESIKVQLKRAYPTIHHIYVEPDIEE